MEISLVKCLQTSIQRGDFSSRKLGFGDSRQICWMTNRIGFGPVRKLNQGAIRVASKAIRSEMPGSEAVVIERDCRTNLRKKMEDRLQFFVGLPLDCHSLQNAKAIEVGLKALKLLGVEGMDLPVWWGVAEEGPSKYDWSNYILLAKMVQHAGLKLHISICFHASDGPTVQLPQWVSQVGETHPNIFFTDRSGRRYKNCLSLAVDDLPVLEGRTPLEVYGEFFESFKSSFSEFMGSTITDISVGLGPHGELRYPSFPVGVTGPAVGEFQCFDKYMLAHLKQEASIIGHWNWGLGGPHDAPHYQESPDRNGFMRDGGSWETPYGDFFLSWYSAQLLSHGDRMLSLASTAFGSCPVMVSGKVPLIHTWYRTRSHPSELTAGFFNTASRDGYNAVAEMFARNSCAMVIPGMDLSDSSEPAGSQSSPESLLSQIIAACRRHGVNVSGENSMASSTSSSFSKIKERISSSEDPLTSFTYQRIGAYFFSPKHFPLFSEFVRSLDRMELHVDDLPVDGEVTIADQINQKDQQMQAV